jgi:two-component system, NarL family, nitrate/nitrite response regulator NarL
MNGAVKKAVLVDDSDIDLYIQKRFLEVYQFCSEMDMYNSTRAALEAIRQCTPETAPEVIFLDLNMPDADGFTFLKEFNQLPDSVQQKSRIVVLTSSESKIDRNYVLSFNNVIHFITKPLKQSDIEELKEIFKNQEFSKN